MTTRDKGKRDALDEDRRQRAIVAFGAAIAAKAAGGKADLATYLRALGETAADPTKDANLAKMDEFIRKVRRGISFRPATLGLEADPGWLVFFAGSYAMALYERPDGTIGNTGAAVSVFCCTSCNWPSIKEAKREVRAALTLMFVKEALKGPLDERAA